MPPSRGGRPRLLLIVMAAVLGPSALGCGASATRARRLPASVFKPSKARMATATGKPPTAPPLVEARPGHESAALVAAHLERAGLRFGTDGTTGALWGYLSQSHQVIPPSAARPGDVLFFDTRASVNGMECADHTGLIERVEPDGRLVFAEVRGGALRRAVVDPARPALRRTEQGEIANSFLRKKALDDPPEARYLAGEMLCGVVRPTPTK